MDFCYQRAFGVESPDAYEMLLLDVMRGDATLFIRSDEAEAPVALDHSDRGSVGQRGRKGIAEFTRPAAMAQPKPTISP